MRRTAAGLALVAVAPLLAAAPAQAVELPAQCRANASKIRQSDHLAPLVVGDSVTVAAGQHLAEHGFAVDAVGCRMWVHGLEALAGRRTLPGIVVIALGSNGDTTPRDLEQALKLVGPFGRLILVLPNELGGGPDPDGRLMREFERAYPDQVETLDWPRYSAGESGWFAPDGLHLTTPGAQGFAAMIAEGVEFAPPEQVEPPPEPEPPPERPASRPPPEPPGPHPALVALWRSLEEAVATVVAPGLRLLGQVVGASEALGAQDL